MVQIRRVGKKSFKLYIYICSIKRTRRSNDAASGGDVGDKGVVPGANGLHMGSTEQVSDSEVVFITVQKSS